MIKVITSSQISKDLYKTRSLGSDVQEVVLSIISEVKNHGDQALFSLSAKFDQASPTSFLIPETHLIQVAEELKKDNPKLYDALCYSRDLALKFAKRQRECYTDFEEELDTGLFTGQKTIPVDRAGLYVPAGRFPLLSTVIMCACPALAAGCKDVILCTPPRLHPENKDKPWVDKGILATAYICGITKVYACGGAQAIAAMAYGTQSIPKCDVIVGPGNKFVAEAKKSIYGDAGIDMVAGPSEVFIIADKNANPEWVAADMLAQAEHDPDAQAILATDSQELIAKVTAEIEKQLVDLPTKDTASKSIENNGLIILTKDLNEAIDIANKKAPEHLEIALDSGKNRDNLVSQARNFGSLFIGHEAAEVLGDYAAGLNHTLPTSGSARFTGGLSVRMFLKTVTTLRTENNRKSAKAASILGDTEGLAAHARAARFRITD